MTQTEHDTRQNEQNSKETRRTTQMSTHLRQTPSQSRRHAVLSPFPRNERASRDTRVTYPAPHLSRTHISGAHDHTDKTRNAPKWEQNTRISANHAHARDVRTRQCTVTSRRTPQTAPQLRASADATREQQHVTSIPPSRPGNRQKYETHTHAHAHKNTDNTRRQQESTRMSGLLPLQRTAPTRSSRRTDGAPTHRTPIGGTSERPATTHRQRYETRFPTIPLIR